MTDQRPPVNVFFYGTTLPTPEQMHELTAQLTNPDFTDTDEPPSDPAELED